MASGEIPRFDNGLINFYELAHYYPPNFVQVPFGIFEDITWENHHAYYLYREWNQPEIRPADRSPKQQLFIDFRSERYNRLMLLVWDEERLHQDYLTVDPEGLEPATALASRNDFRVLDSLGAATIALNIMENPQRYYGVEAAPLISSSGLEHVSMDERKRFFQARQAEALTQLETPEVTPKDVIASIIARYAIHLKDETLRGAVPADDLQDGIIYPFDLPVRRSLVNWATGMLTRSYPVEEPEGERFAA